MPKIEIRPVPKFSVEHNAPARLRVLRVPGSHKVKHAKVHRGNAHRMRRKDLKKTSRKWIALCFTCMMLVKCRH